MTRGPNVLPYEDSMNVDGLTVTRGDGFFRVVTPRPSGLKAIGKGYFVGLAFCIYMLAGLGIGMYKEHGGDRLDLMFNAFFYGVIIAAVVWSIALRLQQSYVFEVSRDHFTFRLARNSSPGKAWILRRDLVRETNPSCDNKAKLIIHVTGRDMIELYVHQDAALVQRLSALINEALRQPLPEVNTALPSVIDHRHTNPLAAKLMTAFGILGFAAAVAVGVVTASVGAAVMVLAVVGIPAGIYYGTQNKEYYL